MRADQLLKNIPPYLHSRQLHLIYKRILVFLLKPSKIHAAAADVCIRFN